MCHFITATLSRGADADLIREIARRFGRDWKPLRNRHVLGQLGQGEGYFLTTRARCDCGTQIGSARQEASDSPDGRASAKLRRKGWGEAKIERWVSEQRRTKLKRARELDSHLRRAGADVDSWGALLRALFEESRVAFVGLLLHSYSGSVESERIDLSRDDSLPVAELDGAFLLQIEEDVLYRFRRS